MKRQEINAVDQVKAHTRIVFETQVLSILATWDFKQNLNNNSDIHDGIPK